MEPFIFVGWLVLCGASAVYATNKGRDGVGIFFLSLFLSPLVGFVVAFATAPYSRSVVRMPKRDPDPVTKKCPDWAESIRIEALVCRFCGRKFQPEEVHAAVQRENWDRLR
jgi:phosphate/sulfate permease